MNWQTQARVSPASFACVTSGLKLQYAKHWRLMDQALLKIANGTIRKLIINIPPQFGKSELVSRHFPAWYLGEYPDRKIILTSYEATYAALWGMKARELYRSWGKHIWGRNLDPAKSTTDWWFTDKQGYMTTAGALGAVTGKGAHVLIIDDPHKNAAEAHSKTMREKIWDNYTSTLLTRLQPEGSIILVQTRWHEDDLTGRLIKREGDQWEKIVLPALDDKEESLFPNRYSAEELKSRRATMGSYMFGALYQQSPTPAEGGMFKKSWIRYYERLPESFDIIIQTWDLTFGDTGDSFVVGLVLGKVGSETYVLDMKRDKWAFPQQIKQIKQTSNQYPNSGKKLIEKKANGQATIDTLKGEISGIVPVTPTESKDARASAVSYVVEAGNVLFPKNASWTETAVDELTSFPNGQTDDIVDALTQGLSDLYVKPSTSFGTLDWI